MTGLPAALALALAFILPGPVLLRQVGQRRAEALPPSFSIQGVFVLIGADARSFAQERGLPLEGAKLDRLVLDATLSLSGGRCELELSHAGRPLGSVAEKGAETTSSGAVPPAALSLASEGCAPFVYHGVEAETQLSRLLVRLGGDPANVSLTRFDGRVAYAIGGEATALTVSQRRLLPLRLIGGPGREELRFREYRAILLGGAFPGRLELWRGGEEAAELEARLVAR